MGRRCHGGRFSPGQEGIGRNEAFAPLQMLLAVIGDLLSELVCMREKKVDLEGARSIEHLYRGSEGRAFLAIGPSLGAFAQIKK